MNFGQYRLLAQVGAGQDGIAYHAEHAVDGAAVEIRVLAGAHADPQRWKLVEKRLRWAALLDHAAALKVHELLLDEDPPWLVMERSPVRSLAAALHSPGSLPARIAAALAKDLAAVLTAAHRLGLAHGRLCPGEVFLTSRDGPIVDFTDLNTSGRPDDRALRNLNDSCRAPETASGKGADLAGDVYSLGTLLHALIQGGTLPARADVPASQPNATAVPCARSASEDAVRETLASLAREMLAPDPAERPAAGVVHDRLAAVMRSLAATRDSAVDVPAKVAHAPTMILAARTQPDAFVPQGERVPLERALAGVQAGQQLGRFELLEVLGEGGMGKVFRARDLGDGSIVAIKILRAERSDRPHALSRFHKEARLLAEVNNPYVTNLLELNEDRGIHYLVMEYVRGWSLEKVLAERTRFEEPLALAITADVARALVDAHERGIVHRDIKPENILLVASEDFPSGTTVEDPAAPARLDETSPRVKLSDFGLARHVVETESLQVTKAGALVGTPYYMSPEQCTGGVVDPRSDIYALGATLFHLLAGRPPFTAPTTMGLINAHCQTPAPPLEKFNPAVSEGTCLLVRKCLAKAPDARYANARALLRDLEHALRGEPTSIAVHPRLPACRPQDLVQYDWTWELESSPQQLWPYVSNTERFNRAVGLSAVAFTTEPDPERGTRRHGRFSKLGITMQWQEHPFEWIEGRRMGVLREYQRGPLKWLVSVVELNPRAGGGTTLAHRIRLEPVGVTGRAVAKVEVGVNSWRAFDRLYRRMDAALTGKLGSPASVDPFEAAAPLPRHRRRRLGQVLDRLSEHRIDPLVVERLGEFLAGAPAQAVARIRPLALARRYALDPNQVVAACLHGAREGLLVLLWDVLCPVCRIPSEIKDTLRELREHGHCAACNLDYELDFANSVEMIFRAHPEVRESDLATYCIGGPAHSPHVAAQVRLAPAEHMELELALAEGDYRLRGPQLPFSIHFRVEPAAPLRRWQLTLSRGLDPELPRSLKTGSQVLVLTNDQPHELVVRVERTAPRDDALTAARASALALFRDLFPGEILSPGQLVSVSTVTLLVTGLDQTGDLYAALGDAQAFALIHEHFRLLEERIRGEGGALVKTVGEGLLAAFQEPLAAVRVALDVQDVLAKGQTTRDLRVRVAVHRGPAMAATLNDHLDYFGSTVNLAGQLPALAQGGEVILTQTVAGDQQVAALLRARGLQAQVLADRAELLVHRLVPEDSARPHVSPVITSPYRHHPR